MTAKISVLLVDDHSLVRRGFRRILEDEQDIAVVGEAGDGEEAIRLATKLQPRVIVMDCALPGISGIEAIRRIRHQGSDVPIGVLTMLESHAHPAIAGYSCCRGCRRRASLNPGGRHDSITCKIQNNRKLMMSGRHGL